MAREDFFTDLPHRQSEHAQLANFFARARYAPMDPSGAADPSFGGASLFASLERISVRSSRVQPLMLPK